MQQEAARLCRFFLDLLRSYRSFSEMVTDESLLSHNRRNMGHNIQSPEVYYDMSLNTIILCYSPVMNQHHIIPLATVYVTDSASSFPSLCVSPPSYYPFTSYQVAIGLTMRNTLPYVVFEIWLLNILNHLHRTSMGVEIFLVIWFVCVLNLWTALSLSKLTCVSQLEIVYSQLRAAV